MRHALIGSVKGQTGSIIDAATCRDRGTIPIGKGADGPIFDARRRLGFVPSDLSFVGDFFD